LARALRGDHHNIDIFSRNDRSIINRESVSEEKRLARRRFGAISFFVNGRISVSGSARKMTSPRRTASAVSKTLRRFRLARERDFTSTVKANNDFDPTIAQVERMGAFLCAKADHGAGLSF